MELSNNVQVLIKVSDEIDKKCNHDWKYSNLGTVGCVKCKTLGQIQSLKTSAFDILTAKSMILNEKISELRKLAEACRYLAGDVLEEWHANEFGVSPPDEVEPLIAEVIVKEYAAFIAAANPLTIITLLDRIKELETVKDSLLSAINDTCQKLGM